MAEAVSKLLTFTAFAYLARLYGPVGYGYIEWAGTVLMCASLIVDQGFSAYGTREIARSPSDTGRLVAEVVTARFLLAVTAYAVIGGLAYVMADDRAISSLLLVYGLSLWALPLLLQWVFQGHDKMHVVGVTQVIRQTIFALVVFLVVQGSGDLVWVGIAEVAGVSAAAAFSVWTYFRYFKGEHTLRPSFSRKLFREGTPIGLSQMFWVLKMFGATLIVGLIATAEDTGYFAGAMRIYIALHTFVWLYFFNMLPTLSRAWVQGPEQLATIIGGSMRVVLAASIVVGVIWVALAANCDDWCVWYRFSPWSDCIAMACRSMYRCGNKRTLQVRTDRCRTPRERDVCDGPGFDLDNSTDSPRLFQCGYRRCGGRPFCGGMRRAGVFMAARTTLYF